jgi:hypothetical protein
MKQNMGQQNFIPASLRKLVKGNKASRTSGKEKPNCKITPLDKYMAKRGRAYKHPLYGAWCEKMDKKKGNTPNKR